jgi:hypothetical protein
MEIERQTHQREEKAMVQEALEKVEATKREYDGIPSSLVSCSFFSFLAPSCLIFLYYLV